jgi:hypothetical protein
MPETVTLPAPIVRTKTQTNWQLEEFRISIKRKMVHIVLIGDNEDEVLTANYPTPPPTGSSQPSGVTLINALNTANLSTRSLVKRMFERLIADGYIAGTVTGTPD